MQIIVQQCIILISEYIVGQLFALYKARYRLVTVWPYHLVILRNKV